MAEAQSARAYLLECCALDAAEDGERIMAMRRARRSGDGSGETAALDRRSIEARLVEIRREFYGLDLDDLKARITSVNTGTFLDLERYQQRLLRVANSRASLDRAEHDRAVDSAFLESYRGVLILPNDERRSFRAKVERHFRTYDNRKSARRTVARLRKAYPDVFALDLEWLDKFLDKEKASRGRLFRGSFFLWVFGGMACFRVIRFLFQRIFGDD